MSEAAKDFALRKDEKYLSFFEVADEAEGRRVAAAFKVIGDGPPDKIDFMLFARQFLLESGIELDRRPNDGLPEFLSSRHLGTRGPQHEPNSDFINRLLFTDGTVIIRVNKNEVERIARTMIDDKIILRDHLGEHWQSRLFVE